MPPSHSTPRRPAPWLRSVDESVPKHLYRRRLTAFEAIAAATMIVAVIAFAVWFLFFASGGPGFGTV